VHGSGYAARSVRQLAPPRALTLRGGSMPPRHEVYSEGREGARGVGSVNAPVRVPTIPEGVPTGSAIGFAMVATNRPANGPKASIRRSRWRGLALRRGRPPTSSGSVRCTDPEPGLFAKPPCRQRGSQGVSVNRGAGFLDAGSCGEISPTVAARPRPKRPLRRQA